MLNERDGGIGGVKLIVEECETGYDTKKGVECYDSVKGKQPGRHHAVFDRHHAATDPQGGGRQDSDFVDGLRPLGLGRRQSVPVDFQSAGDLLGRRFGIHSPRRRRRRRLRQAQGQEDRPRPSRRALRQGADPAAAGARAGLRLRAQALSGAGAADAEPELALARRPARPARLDLSPGLGRHESDRDQGSGQDRLPDESAGRRVVVGQRRRRASGRPGGEGL